MGPESVLLAVKYRELVEAHNKLLDAHNKLVVNHNKTIKRLNETMQAVVTSGKRIEKLEQEVQYIKDVLL